MTHAPSEGLRVSIDGGVVTLTLARPERLNALTFASYRALRTALDSAAAAAAIRAIVLAGEGGAFCSGGDVDDVIGELVSRDAQGLLEFTRATGSLVGALRRLPKPVVPAIDGVAVGAGAVIALACDLRIASDRARIGFIFPRVGLSGADMGAAYLLPRVVGLGRASELLLTGDIVGAEEARAIGLVNRVVAAPECLAAARALARRLASGPAFAHAMTKQMLESEQAMAIDQALEAEAQAQALCWAHPDFGRGCAAGRSGRATRFAGATEDFEP